MGDERMSDHNIPPPGRERDVAIAQVLGSRWWYSSDSATMPPHWSTSDAAAVELLAEATKRGWMWEVRADETGVRAWIRSCGMRAEHAAVPDFADAVSGAFLKTAQGLTT